MEVTTNLVARGNFTFDIAPCRDKELSTIPNRKDVVDLYVLSQIVKENNQRFVLHRGVVLTHDSERCSSVLAVEGAIFISDHVFTFKGIGADGLVDLEICVRNAECFSG